MLAVAALLAAAPRAAEASAAHAVSATRGDQKAILPSGPAAPDGIVRERGEPDPNRMVGDPVDPGHVAVRQPPVAIGPPTPLGGQGGALPPAGDRAPSPASIGSQRTPVGPPAAA